MNTALYLLTNEAQINHYQQIVDFLTMLGFLEFKPEFLDLERKALQLSKPKKKRQYEGQQCSTFRKYFWNGYYIEVIPRFNNQKQEFTRGGQITVQIKSNLDPGHRIFGMYFKKWTGVEDRVSNLVTFLNQILHHENFPRDGRGVPMELVRPDPKEKWTFVFRSRKAFPKEEIHLLSSRFLKLVEPIAGSISKMFATRDDYQERSPVGRQRLSNIIHQRTIKRSSGALSRQNKKK